MHPTPGNLNPATHSATHSATLDKARRSFEFLEQSLKARCFTNGFRDDCRAFVSGPASSHAAKIFLVPTSRNSHHNLQCYPRLGDDAPSPPSDLEEISTISEWEQYRHPPFDNDDLGRICRHASQSSPKPNCFPLLLCNRKTFFEVQASVTGGRFDTYKLDIVCYNRALLLPFWTYVPVSLRHIKKVEIIFRSYEDDSPSPRDFPAARTTVDFCGSLYMLLGGFFRFGTQFWGGVATDRFVDIEHIELRLIRPKETSLKRASSLVPPNGDQRAFHISRLIVRSCWLLGSAL